MNSILSLFLDGPFMAPFPAISEVLGGWKNGEAVSFFFFATTVGPDAASGGLKGRFLGAAGVASENVSRVGRFSPGAKGARGTGGFGLGGASVKGFRKCTENPPPDEPGGTVGFSTGLEGSPVDIDEDGGATELEGIAADGPLNENPLRSRVANFFLGMSWLPSFPKRDDPPFSPRACSLLGCARSGCSWVAIQEKKKGRGRGRRK